MLAIIVNYKSAVFTFDAVEALLASNFDHGLQTVVVDNSEDPREMAYLSSKLPDGVVLRANQKNNGFGEACNRIFSEFSGDEILLLNPDAILLPNTLEILHKTLNAEKKVGAVSPGIFWDKDLTCHLPPSHSPSLFFWEFVLNKLDRKSTLNRLIAACWQRYALKVWQAKGPLKMKNLSGSLVLLKREAVHRAGGLFDPRFFLYFEDTDLFMRLRKTGYSLIMDPRAKAIHYYDQCGKQEWQRKRELMETSYGLFLEKHAKSHMRYLERIAGLFGNRGSNNQVKPLHSSFKEPFVLDVPAHLEAKWLFEISPHLSFVPSAGIFGSGNRMIFNDRLWNQLTPGQYFVRLGAAKPFRNVSGAEIHLLEKN